MLTQEETSSLNEFLNTLEDLPVHIEAINTKLRELFNQDTTTTSPEVVADIAESEATPAPTEEVVPAPEEVAPVQTEAVQPEVASIQPEVVPTSE